MAVDAAHKNAVMCVYGVAMGDHLGLSQKELRALLRCLRLGRSTRDPMLARILSFVDLIGSKPWFGELPTEAELAETRADEDILAAFLAVAPVIQPDRCEPVSS